jgi:3D (Asp-Asp-Asp) domain-containing protein
MIAAFTALLLATAAPRHYEVSSTCYAQGGVTASGEDAYLGEVAVLPGFLPLGTHIRLDHPEFGRRNYVVLDHIGHGSELDIFNPSEEACIQYGRREIGFTVSR